MTGMSAREALTRDTVEWYRRAEGNENGRTRGRSLVVFKPY